MMNFFCSICISDKILHPRYMDKDIAIGDCDTCGSELQTSWTRPEIATEEQLTLEEYNRIHGLDNNTP
jgi:hypothetical protein